jgi:hypothetical protein
MRKIMSNIVALAVLIVLILFCGSVFTITLFSLVAFARMNGWLALVISWVTAGSLAFACGNLAKTLGVKLEL